MPSPPVLFVLTTARVRLLWSGPATDLLDARETVRATPTRGTSGLRLDVGGERVEGEGALRLAEETTYRVWLESLTGEPVALGHADPVVTAALAPARGGTIVHGTVRFGSQAGRSRFVVSVAGRAEVFLDLTVAPTKASWADVEAMREAVEAAAAGAALAAVRPTSVGSDPTAGLASGPAWLALLREAGPRLVRAIAGIARDPETVTVRPLVAVRPSALRRASTETVRALRVPGGWPERVPGRPARAGLDTPAHRWLAAGLDAVLARARVLRTAEAARPPSLRRTAVVGELDRLGSTLTVAGRIEPLRAVGGAAPPAVPRVPFRRPAYGEAVTALVSLQHALRLAGSPLAVPAQDLAVLYESWAALAAVGAFARAVGVDVPARPFGAVAVGSRVRLGRGRGHAVRLAGSRAIIEVIREPRFAGPPALLVQIPDLLVTLRRPGGLDVRVVLDAKYRLADGNAGAPPDDALGALHRYRDAIVGPDGGAGWIREAVALFPHRAGDAFGRSRLWTSLDAIGIGAVPLLPGATGWLDRYAERLSAEAEQTVSGG